MNYPEPIVGALIVNHHNEVLLIKQKKWNDQFCIPGGHVELNESIEDAIKREVYEEVGLKVIVQPEFDFKALTLNLHPGTRKTINTYLESSKFILINEHL